MEDTSLDEFLNSTDEDADSEAEGEIEADTETGREIEADETTAVDENVEVEREAEDGTDSDAEADVRAVDSAVEEPALSTSRWVHGDEECPSCGTATARLWNDDGQFVCRRCKEW